MQTERILSEIKSIRQKYSCAIFDLEKSKDTVNKLTSEKNDLFEKHAECEKVILELKKENELVTTQLSEALEKINLLTSKVGELQKKDSNTSTQEVNSVNVESFRGERELRQLKEQNNVLQARLKQAECGIAQNKSFERKDDDLSEHDEDYEVEKILKHKIQRGKLRFLIRCKGFGPDSDTWEPQSNLNCPKILENYMRHHKI